MSWINVCVSVEMDDIWEAMSKSEKKQMVKMYGGDDAELLNFGSEQGGHTKELKDVIQKLLDESSSHLELTKKLETLL